jgi:hypothetical protein
MIDDTLVADLTRTFAAALDHEDGASARRELLAAGWLDALAHDEPVAVAVLFRIQGATLRDAAALDDVVARHLAGCWQEIGDDLAIAYPFATPLAGEPGATHVVLPSHRDASRLLWLPDLAGDDMRLVEVDGIRSARAVGGVDAELGLLALSAPPTGRSTSSAPRGATAVWAKALAAGRVALAHQMIAGAHTLLVMATTYARARHQFGQPIASFQAIKHRLAETLVAISSADAAAVAAASNREPTTAAVAKALAGRAAAVAARNCLQVFGGIGFTVEHEFHRYFRRGLVLDRLLGDQRTLERELGRRLRDGALEGDRIIELDQARVVDGLGPSISG